jgi:hypothetical protein
MTWIEDPWIFGKEDKPEKAHLTLKNELSIIESEIW